MKTARFLAASALIALWTLCPPAAGDWDPGDPHKMHFPQLPDPEGWDVDFTYPQFLADDWLCTETGPVTDVHFWFSFEQDIVVPIETIHLSVHNNIPAQPGGFSRPGDLLWERDFPIGTPGVTIRPYGTGSQGWFEPKSGLFRRPDHFQFFQANIEEIIDPFIQDFGTIYWLDISVLLAPGTSAKVGWKTSRDHFEDDAVWAHFDPAFPPDWRELRDPLTGESLDMAFVITPEPTSLALLLLGGLAALRIRR